MTIPVASPRTLREALRLLEAEGEGVQPLAGGTDLVVELASGRRRAERVLDLWKLAELRGIRAEGGGLCLGALTTCAELARSGLARERADLVVQAARECGAAQIQSRATLGGNLGTASPAADLVPALMALGASVRLVSRAGERELAVSDAIVGYRAIARRPDELIHSFLVPERAPGERRAFRKVGTRAAQAISKVVVALALRMDGERVGEVRAAAGAVAPRSVLLGALGRELRGQRPEPALLAQAARAAALEDAAPIDDLRSSARYRRLVLGRVLNTLLHELCARPT